MCRRACISAAAPIAYIGTQSAVAFLYTLVDTGPPPTILPPVERLVGIMLGVALMSPRHLGVQPPAAGTGRSGRHAVMSGASGPDGPPVGRKGGAAWRRHRLAGHRRQPWPSSAAELNEALRLRLGLDTLGDDALAEPARDVDQAFDDHGAPADRSASGRRRSGRS